MKGKNMNKGKTMLICMIIIAVCAMLVMGGTYALFTDTDTYNNRLQAGKLDISLTRVEYIEKVLDANGYMVESEPDKTKVSLTEDNSPLFKVTNEDQVSDGTPATIIVPTTWYQSKIEVGNNGDVAFDYGVRVTYKQTDTPYDTEKVDALKKQIRITIFYDDDDTPRDAFFLKDAEGRDISLGTMVKNGEVQNFTIKMEFVDDKEINAGITDEALYQDNDLVQNMALNVDIQVYATQKTAPETTTAP